MEMKATAVFQL